MPILLAALGRPGPSATSVIVNYWTARPWADHRLIEARRLLHIAIACEDNLAVAAFYQDVFGMVEVERRPHPTAEGVFFVSVTDGHINLALVYLIRQSLQWTDNCKRLRERRRIVNGEWSPPPYCMLPVRLCRMCVEDPNQRSPGTLGPDRGTSKGQLAAPPGALKRWQMIGRYHRDRSGVPFHGL